MSDWAPAAVALGLSATEGFLFGVGVAVALVPEGMLPTVTLSLARGAQTMAGHNALVRRLDAVETLGATTFICTDKTGTLTQNRMNVVEVITPAGPVTVVGDGYGPVATMDGSPAATALLPAIARAAVACVTGRAVDRTATKGDWQPLGDPMEAALHCLALRVGADVLDDGDEQRRSYAADRMLTSALGPSGEVSVLGAPESVLPRCTVSSTEPAGELEAALLRLTSQGCRVLAVARRAWSGEASAEMETELELLGLVALEDPPRPDVREALLACRAADIRVAMVSGDHPRTAEAIAREVGLLDEGGGLVVTGDQLPQDEAELAALLDRPDGVVVARVTPADKFRIASALRGRGHVVAMTGDGVNDAPALRQADVGIAFGASGSDVAREAADLVLLDDHFATIVTAVELGRATFRNIRRFLTYHLTDNVAELAPFAVWAMTGGQLPTGHRRAAGARARHRHRHAAGPGPGAEPPRKGIMKGRSVRKLIDRSLLVRALAVLGATEAVMALGAFSLVLLAGGWSWGSKPRPDHLLFVASGSAFATIAVCQMANAFACRSSVQPVWAMSLLGNKLVLAAVAAELVLLVLFLDVPGLAHLLGGGWPSPLGWLAAAVAGVALVLVDGAAKHARRRSQRDLRLP